MSKQNQENRNSISFSEKEMNRYNRHFILQNFGIEAQQKLKNTRLLVIGCGGLGNPLLLYLCAAGVGTIGIIDFDVVDESNLQRQVLFTIEDIGELKVVAAKKRLEKLNPYVNFEIHTTKLTTKNALELFENYDLVADGTDNFSTRYLVNDACVLLQKPLIYASIFQYEGQVSVFNYTDKNGITGPNYRDLFPTPPENGQIPNCAEGGVLGILPGIIGTMQANEVIKVVTGIGIPLNGKLMIFNALTMSTTTITFEKNKATPKIEQLIDYDLFCGVKSKNEITVVELINWIKNNEDFELIDVREPHEYQTRNLHATNIPLGQLIEKKDEINPNKKVVIHCKSGARSSQAITQLEEYGFTNLFNLTGGIDAVSIEQEKTLLSYSSTIKKSESKG